VTCLSNPYVDSGAAYGRDGHLMVAGRGLRVTSHTNIPLGGLKVGG